MSKSERLFDLVTLLGSRRTAITAQQIAQQMDVSVRTVYRDIQSLQASGIHIEGEPGIGYLMGKRNHLPPLMFTPEQALAIVLGSKMVQAFTDPKLAEAALAAETKITAVLPESQKLVLENQPYRIPLLGSDDQHRQIHALLRDACEHKIKVQADYLDLKGSASSRLIWPLGIIGWFGKWTLLAWCELRQDYRNFRFDRFLAIQHTQYHFETSGHCSLEHYLELVYRECPKH